MVTISSAMAAYAPPSPVTTGPLPLLQGKWRATSNFTPLAATASTAQPATTDGECVGSLTNAGYALNLAYTDVVEGVLMTGVVSITYDANAGRFVEHASSNFGELSVAYGDYDEATKTLSFKGETTNPDTGASEAFVSEYVIKNNVAYDWNFYLVDTNGNKTMVKSGSFLRA